MGNNHELLINIENLSKYYKLYDKPSDRLKEALNLFKKNYHKDFAALEDISLTIKKGEAVGIIGKNGAGKSTLLKIITGVLSPSSGNIEVNGKISALLELGAGFNPEFTGLENIYLNGTIMGFTKEEMDKKLPDILNFADIGDFVHQPVKTYSSGMFARLAFSVSINVEPDILIVDEALSVGDMYFQAKCMKKIKELMETGVTTLFVSHDTMAVKSLCTRAVYIEHGTIVADGDSGEVCDQYINDTLRNTGSFSNLKSKKTNSFSDSEEKAIHSNIEENTKVVEYKNRVRNFRNGTFELEVIYVTTVNDQNKETTEFLFNEQITVKIYIKSNVEIKEAIIACYIKDKNQINIIGTNSTYEGIEIKDLKKNSIYMLEFKFTNKLMAGNYSISVLAVDELLNSNYYERVDNTFIFKALDIPNKRRWALVSLPMDVQFKKIGEG